MKTKLNRIFILIALALLGIIIFQIYWTVNAYKVNKEKFDNHINVAMQSAMDDCKKDYFDSIRRVLVKRLSPPETVIKIDTLPQPGNIISPAYGNYDILFLHKNTLPDKPFSTTKFKLDLYRKKINHKATMPEVLTEMSFYEPTLMQHIGSFLLSSDYGLSIFTPDEIQGNSGLFRSSKSKGNFISAFAIKYKSLDSLNRPAKFYKHARDSAIRTYLKQNNDMGFIMAGVPGAKKHYASGSQAALTANKKQSFKIHTKPQHSTYHQPHVHILEYPPNFRKADSLKLYKYFEHELEKVNIYSPFKLTILLKSTPPAKFNMHFSETGEYNYRYHGFKVFGYGDDEFFIRAVFKNPQYSVLRGMLLLLLLSIFLVLFVVFCFNYIIKTFIEQKKLADLKDDFINNMTHELKTPIATITVAIEGLQKFNALHDAEKTQRYLQTSRNELARLNDLVTKVLDIATFENKQIDLVKEPLNINDLINEATLSEKAKTTKEVQIDFLNKAGIELIYADKIHFRNVLINLIDNAIKYSKEPVHLVINCNKSGNNIVIAIKDNGIGIPVGHIHQVFDKFHRVPTGNIHSVKGTGLGLSYVKYIVEAHGGSITVKSEVNKGSEFTITIPVNNG